MRRLALIAGLAWALDASASRTTDCLKSRAQATDDVWELNCFGGTFAGLDAQGRAAQIDTEVGFVTNFAGDPVEFARHSARVLVLPRLGRTSLTSLWGAVVGFRATTYLLHARIYPGDRVSERNSANLGNVELPSVGFVAHTLLDRFRFEIDVAPVVGVTQASRLDGQAALLAALALGPDEDVLFLPNLRTAGRARVFARARFDPFDGFGLAIHARATAGFAEIATQSAITRLLSGANPAGSPVPRISGTVGGAELGLTMLFPTHHWVRGHSLGLAVNAGFTSVWPTDVVLPVRASLTYGIALGRTVELALGFATFTPSIVLGRFEYFGFTLGVRYSPGGDAAWVRASVEANLDANAQSGPLLLPP